MYRYCCAVAATRSGDGPENWSNKSKQTYEVFAVSFLVNDILPIAFVAATAKFAVGFWIECTRNWMGL